MGITALIFTQIIIGVKFLLIDYCHVILIFISDLIFLRMVLYLEGFKVEKSPERFAPTAKMTFTCFKGMPAVIQEITWNR
jgi:hypothetical protein